MVKSLRKTIAIVLVLTAFFGFTPTGVYAASDESELYPVEFYWDKAGEDADNGYTAYSVPFGAPLVSPDKPSRYGYDFIGWQDWYSDQLVDIDTQTMDNTLGRKFYAKWKKTLFSVRFYINDELVSEKTVKPGALITAPEVEPIEGYSIKQWYAVPDSVLTVVYYLPFSMVDCDVNCYAVLKPNTYTSEFYVDGKLFTTVENVFGEPFITPRSPSKDGYSFTGWSPKIPKTTPAENLRFDAQFEPQKYIAALLVDGEVYKEIPYTYGQKSISLPPVPEKEGYTGEWESYTLGIGGVTINAVYTPNTYTSEFYVDGKLFTTVENVFGEAFITPRSPSKDGYSFKGWSPKLPETTPAENLRFDAQFEPQKYIATLLVDGEVYKEIPYTYGQKSISLPPVPEKEGYSGKWENYSLGIGGVTINAVYTADPHVYSVSTASMSMYYKSKEALIYKVRADEGADYKVTFKSSNPEVATVDKNGIVYGAQNGTTTITVTVKDSNGNVFKDTCTVQVQYNILQWIIVILLFGWIWY